MPSPFSCFSPSYQDTIPRQRTAANSHSALTQLNANYPSPTDFGNDGLGRSRSVGWGKVDMEKERGYKTKSQALQKMRSYGANADRRRVITKAQIGLPTNFVHVGHAGRPTDTKNLSSTMADISAALRTSLSTSRRASSPTPSVPTKNTVLPSPSPQIQLPDENDPSLQTSPTRRVNVRKPPPTVTPSVIRQAGPEAVAATAGNKRPLSPPPVLGNLPARAAAQALPAKSLHLGPTEPDGPMLDDLGRPMVKVGSDYMTQTMKGRYDGAMRDIQDALKDDNEQY